MNKTILVTGASVGLGGQSHMHLQTVATMYF